MMPIPNCKSLKSFQTIRRKDGGSKGLLESERRYVLPEPKQPYGLLELEQPYGLLDPEQ